MNNKLIEQEQMLFSKFKQISLIVEDKYSYLVLNNEKKDKLLQQAFTKFLQNISKINDDNISLEIENYLNKEYLNLLKELLVLEDNKKVLNDYTNNYFTYKAFSKDISKNLENYTDDLIALNPNISYEDCLYLIKNNEYIKNGLETIIYSANEKINLFKIDELLQTNLSILLEPFCQYYNISTEDNDSLNDEIYEYNSKESKNDNYLTDNIVHDYLRSLPPALTIDEERKCFLALASGQKEMKNYLIEHNLKFVVSVAKRYQGKGLALMDLIQEGNIGLIKAVERFDVEKGFKFVSYASWWIRQAIIIAINEKGRTIRLPAYVNQKLRKINYLKHYISNNLGHDATTKELAMYMNMNEKDLEDFLKNTSDSISYNVLVGEKEENELQDFLEANIDIENDLIRDDLKRQIIPSLKNLSSREQYILIERIVNRKSLESVAKTLNITRERVRQIEEKALIKLRGKKQIKDTMIYLDNPESISLPKQKFTLVKTIGSKKDCVLEAITYLDEEERQLLFDAYGKNYENKVEANYSDELNELIIKLKIFTYAIKKPEKITILNNSLFSYFTFYEKEDILEAIDTLSDNKKKLLKEKYPNGFDEKPIIMPVAYEDYLKREVFGNISKKLKEKKEETIKKSNNIITLTSLREAFSNLTTEEKEKILNLFKPSDEEEYFLENLIIMSKDDAFLKLIKYANNIENTSKFDIDIKTASFLSLTSATSIEEVKYHLNFLLPSEIKLLNLRFGTNFLQKIKLHDIEYPKKRRIVTKILPKLNERIVKLRMPLEKALDVDSATVKRAITYFENEDQKLLNTLYNYKDYDYVLTEKDYIRIVSKLLPVLKNIINNLKLKGTITPNTSIKINSLYEKNSNLRYNTTRENLKEIVAELSKEEQSVFYKKFGPNLDEYNTNLTAAENNLYKNISMKINRKINKQNKEKERRTLLQESFKQIRKIYLNLNEETRNKLSESDRVLLDNLFLEEKMPNIDNLLQKNFLKALRNILEISRESNIEENNKRYLKCIASYIENQVKR